MLEVDEKMQSLIVPHTYMRHTQCTHMHTTHTQIHIICTCMCACVYALFTDTTNCIVHYTSTQHLVFRSSTSMRILCVCVCDAHVFVCHIVWYFVMWELHTWVLKYMIKFLSNSMIEQSFLNGITASRPYSSEDLILDWR